MRKVIFLTKHYGENYGTAKDVIAPWIGQNDVDLTARKSVCLSFDDDRLVSTWLYGFRVVDLPEWFDPAEYPRQCIEWSYFLAYGGDATWPEAWCRSLMRINTVARPVICMLLNTRKFRSAFRQSLRDQCVAWLEAPRESRRFDCPLSGRQVESLVTWDHRRIQSGRAAMAGVAVHGPAYDAPPAPPVLDMVDA